MLNLQIYATADFNGSSPITQNSPLDF